MRFSNPRLVRLGSLVRGAIVETGDSEAIVSPVRQANLDLVDPVNNVIAVGTVADLTVDRSVIKQERIAVTGVAAASNVNILNFARGLWKLYISFQAQFIGTSTNANVSGLNLLDPGGASISVVVFAHYTGNFLAETFEIPLNFQRDGFVLVLTQGATVALDLLALSATIFACKEI